MVEKTPEATVISARQEILRRVRAALGAPQSDRESNYAYIPRQYQIAGKLDARARLELFADRLLDYGSGVYECPEAAISQVIGAALRERGILKVLTGRDFKGGWIPGGFDFCVDADFNAYQIDTFEAVITTCVLAIAETGTIVLRHTDSKTRRALSLIPDYHLCIVFAEQVVETVPQGVRQMALMGSVPLTTISGPSATSDIEMTRIKGVHGPRTMDVVIVS